MVKYIRMNDAVLITRPNHDYPTTYLYHWSKFVLKAALKKGIKILDLDGKKASKSNFNSYVTKHKPRLIFLNGHGAKDRVCGYYDEVLLDITNCGVLLKEKILYVRSCEAGAVLGPISIKKGAIAFIGYKKNYWLMRSKSQHTLPLTDKISKLFLEPSNLVPISLIKGNTVNTAYNKSQESMRKNFSYMISSRASTEERDAAFFLWSNYSCQIMLGDGKAKV